MGAVDVKQTTEHELTLEWDSSASNDMIADSTLTLVTGIDRSPASAKREQFFPPMILYVNYTFISSGSDYTSSQSFPWARACASTRRYYR